MTEVEIFGPSTSGFVMYGEQFLPLFYTGNGSVTVKSVDSLHKLILNLKGSATTNLQTSLGVISPLTQEFLGSGFDSGAQLSLPALEYQLEMKGLDHFALSIKNPKNLPIANTKLFNAYITPFTAQKDLKSIAPPSKSPDFKHVTTRNSLAQVMI